jgi:hypothetical protein
MGKISQCGSVNGDVDDVAASDGYGSGEKWGF